MEVSKILERIGLDYSKEYKANFENLKLLQKSYLLSIPYENLDIILKRGYSTNILKIYEKIVENRRGGISYELNTLFAYLLKSLGFDVKMILAKVDDIEHVGYNFSHLALLVNIDDLEYLVDVGSAQNIREPMNLDDEDYISSSEDKEYKIFKKNDRYILAINNENKSWHSRYNFSKEYVKVSEFEDVFKGNESLMEKVPLLVSQALKNGRATMMDELMIYHNGDDKRTWNISEENRAEVLRDYFNIELDFSDKL